MAKETAREIDAAAAAWAARADRGLSEAEARALDSWLAGDSRRLGAYAKARAVALHSERARALGSGFNPADFEDVGTGDARGLPRRRLLLGAGAVAAGLAGSIGLALQLRRGRYATRRGEVRVFPLEDGSVVTLNTASRVSVDYSPERRSIQLIEGEALFDVAKDRARPFVVAAGDAEVRAVGTSFTVSRLPDTPVRVLVREGVVEVRRRNTAAAAAVILPANTRLGSGAAASEAPVAVPATEVSRELAWREGRIAFEGETLAEAAAEFARYSDTRIVIDDPAIAREEITGLFQANDPVGFARAVAVSLDLNAVVGAGEVRLTR
jgi:transmembrane sensor